jgi:hypothetical protein
VGSQVGDGEALLLGEGQEGTKGLSPTDDIGCGRAQGFGIEGYIMAPQFSYRAICSVPANEAIDLTLTLLAHFGSQGRQKKSSSLRQTHNLPTTAGTGAFRFVSHPIAHSRNARYECQLP